MKKKQLPIGKFLVSRGLLSIEQERKVAETQSKMDDDSMERFGRLAVKMGFLTAEQVKTAVKERSQIR